MFRIIFPILFCVLLALGFRVYGFFLRKCRFSKARRHVRLSSNFADLVSRRVDTSGEGTVFGCFRGIQRSFFLWRHGLYGASNLVQVQICESTYLRATIYQSIVVVRLAVRPEEEEELAVVLAGGCGGITAVVAATHRNVNDAEQNP